MASELEVTTLALMTEVMQGAEPSFTPGDGPGVLLLHDLGETPQVFTGLVHVLSAKGCTVDVPLLPGHGTNIGDLGETSWDDWAVAAQLAFDELSSRRGPVVVVGVGMGATLAAWVAMARPEVAGVVAINARTIPVPPEAFAVMEAMLATGATTVMPLGPDVSNKAEVLAYDTVPIRTLMSMFGALGEMTDHWSELKCPILVVTSARDHRVSPANGQWLAEHAGGPVERLELESSFHVATLDVDHARLEVATISFIDSVCS